MPTPSEIVADLKNLADEIDRAQDEISRNRGRLDSLEESLRKMGLKTTEEAEQRVRDLKMDEESLKKEIDNEYADLKRKYTW